MTVITNSVQIRCTPEEAFDYLSDIRNELEWNPGVESVEKLSDGPVGLGTKFLAKWKAAPKPVEVELIAFDRPRGWTGHNGGPFEVTLTCRLEPGQDGTTLHTAFDVQAHGVFRVIFPIFLRKIRKEEAANMSYIKEALERRSVA